MLNVSQDQQVAYYHASSQIKPKLKHYHRLFRSCSVKGPLWSKQNNTDLPAVCLVSVCKYILLTLNPHR